MTGWKRFRYSEIGLLAWMLLLILAYGGGCYATYLCLGATAWVATAWLGVIIIAACNLVYCDDWSNRRSEMRDEAWRQRHEIDKTLKEQEDAASG